ncbi:MAG TPA: glycosyl hydrolase family 65 protein, partial [Actinomycetes bacterium]|nr:glycosyl hydrolase family 65 protein [Actinomycetes bacterium]
ARWADAEVAIDGDPAAELAVRFALFHLLASAAGDGEAAVGARGLTGPVYAGHVFWDADVFVLPALAALHPEAARAMVEYRIRRLEPARRLAAARGLAGGRFAWESAADGTEVTPAWAINRRGRRVRILTGDQEDHIVAAVPWAARRYADWTGDTALLDGPGRDLLLDTARYWVSRARRDEHGLAHIDKVIGPDEYHVGVDDNAYTNVMARWNLRRAAELAERVGGATADEIQGWRRLADALVDGYDPATGRYRQFTGFDDLEPLLIGELTRLPVAADLLLGLERVRAAQVVKQADVLMLHLLVPEETAPGSLEPNLAYYGPRTAHGSSLSPAVHAALLARAGDPERALELFRLDLDDLTGTSAGGLHVATMGGVWQALATGFLGLDPTGDALGLDPRLPGAWGSVELRLRYHGRRLRLRAGHDQLELATDGPVPVRLPGLPVRTVRPPGASWRRAGRDWTEEPGPSRGSSWAARQGPPGPEASGRSAGAAAGRMGEAQGGGGRRPPRA